MEQSIKIVKVINLDKTYEDSNGKQHKSVNYYVVLNGVYVAIRPSFSKGYTQLDLFAETIKNGKAKNDKK